LQGYIAEGVAPQTGAKAPAYYQRAPAGRDIADDGRSARNNPKQLGATSRANDGSGVGTVGRD